jgi:hypothetical protein
VISYRQQKEIHKPKDQKSKRTGREKLIKEQFKTRFKRKEDQKREEARRKQKSFQIKSNQFRIFGGKSREEASPMAQNEESSQSWDVGKK